MEKSIEIIIGKLAENLGTTSEYIWGVLIKQAPISGAFNILRMMSIISIIFISYKFIKYKTTPKAESDYSPIDSSLLTVIWIFWSIVFILGFFIVLFELSWAMCAFINPEYWALRKILNF